MKEFLDSLAARYNTPDFIADDPVQFPRRFQAPADVEIASILVSTIAWGKRAMILRNAERLLALLGDEPHRFVLGGDIDSIGNGNIHRTFFGVHLRHMLRGLRAIYSQYATLQDFAIACGATQSNAPAWHVAQAMNLVFAQANDAYPLQGPTRGLPSKPETSALKRLNMALRWLVRNDGIVDMGIWTAIKPSQLYIPLDVHSANTARALGLLKRTQNDRRAVEELTHALKRYNADDPTLYDFALFGAGVNGQTPQTLSNKIIL